MQLDPSNEIEQIKQAIAALEGQRGSLGEEVIDTALGPLREKLAVLQAGRAHAEASEKTLGLENLAHLGEEFLRRAAGRLRYGAHRQEESPLAEHQKNYAN